MYFQGGLLDSERSPTSTLIQGVGRTGSASSAFTVEVDGLTFCVNENRVHWSSIIPRAWQAGVPSTTPSSS